MAIMASSKHKRSSHAKSPRPREPETPGPISLEWITDEAASRYLVRSHAMRDSWRRRRKEEENLQAQKLAQEQQQQQQQAQNQQKGEQQSSPDISTLSIRPPPLAAKVTSPRIAPSPLSDRSSPSAGATTIAHHDYEPDQATCRGLAVHYSRDSDDEEQDAEGDVEYEEEFEGYGEAVSPPSLTLQVTSPHQQDEGAHRYRRGLHWRETRRPEFPWSLSHRGSGAEVEMRSSLPAISSANTYQVDPQVESFFAQGVAAVDPFQTCPIAIGPQQEALLQWCKSLSSPSVRSTTTYYMIRSHEVPVYFAEPLLADSIGMGPFAQLFFGHPTRHGEVHPLKEICEEDFHSAATMNAVLACSALHKSLHTGEDNSLISMHHKAEAIRLLNEQLANPALATADVNIATVIRLLCIEDWWGTQETYDTHMRGLDLMIKCRGGIEGLRSNWRTECHYLSVKLITRPRWSYPSSNYPSLDLSPPSLHHGHPSSASRKRIRHLRALVTPLTDLFASLAHSISSGGSALSVLDFPHINQIVRFTHPSNSRARHSSASLTDLQFYVEETSSLAVLLYIALVVRDSRLDPEQNRNLLGVLEHSIQQYIPSWYNAVDLLYFALFKIEIFQLGHTYRFHEVVEIMAAARPLTWPLWIQAKTRLYQLLIGERGGNGVFGDGDDLLRAIIGLKAGRT